MLEQEPLLGLDYTPASEFPALVVCAEGDCGAWRKVHTGDAAAAFLTEHAGKYHDGRLIRFQLRSQKPTDLAAILQPSDTAPEGWQHSQRGPYRLEETQP
jgi:hypothetical protein